MAQTLVPTGNDITTLGDWRSAWTATYDGADSVEYQAVDDAGASTPDTDYLTSQTAGTYFVLFDVTNPPATPASSNVTVTYRVKRGTGTDNISVAAKLYDSSTLKATGTTRTISSTSFAQYSEDLDIGMTPGNNLKVYFEVNSSGADPSQGVLSDIWLTVDDAAGGASPTKLLPILGVG